MPTTILWRYLAVRFVATILMTFFACFVLIFLVDLIEILRQSAGVGRVSFFTLAWITFLRMPAFAELTLPFAVLVGTVTAFLRLSRASELTIMRASGMSVWQFIAPGIIVAAVIGAFSITVFNPLAAAASAESERLRAAVLKRDKSLLRGANGAYLRQNSVDGPSILFAAATSNEGLELAQPFVLQYAPDNSFLARIEAEEGRLRPGYWLLSNVLVTRPDRLPETYGTYAVPTNLTRSQVRDAFTSLFSISFWELDRQIELAERAGLSTTRYVVQQELMLSRPLMLAAMVLLGATVSLRAFRFGGIQSMVVRGLVTGLGVFILAEMSRQLGAAEVVSAWSAAWVPAILAVLYPATSLLYQEDG
ncbi:MAG: LptF/LptG family permease [Pseudomonadota bacterium]